MNRQELPRIRLKVATNVGINILCTAMRAWKVLDWLPHIEEAYREVKEDQQDDEDSKKRFIKALKIKKGEFYVANSQLIGDVFEDNDEVQCEIVFPNIDQKKKKEQKKAEKQIRKESKTKQQQKNHKKEQKQRLQQKIHQKIQEIIIVEDQIKSTPSKKIKQAQQIVQPSVTKQKSMKILKMKPSVAQNDMLQVKDKAKQQQLVKVDIAKLYQKLIPHPNPVADDESSDSDS